jgi:hypothetical protein
VRITVKALASVTAATATLVRYAVAAIAAGVVCGDKSQFQIHGFASVIHIDRLSKNFDTIKTL